MAGDLDSFRVSPTTGGMPTLTVPQVQNVAGQQLSQMGAALSGASKDAQAIYMETLREANALAVNEAVTKAKEQELALTYGENGFTRQKGRAAMVRESGKSLSEEYHTTYEEQLEAIGGSLSNDAQRAAFTRFRQQAGLQLRERLETHTANERHNWFNSNVKGSIGLLQSEIAMGWDDPVRINDAQQALRGHVASLAAENGIAAAEVDLLQRQALGEAHGMAIASMLEQNKFQAAEAYLNEHRGNMDAQSIAKASTALDGEADFVIASQVGQEIMGSVVAEAAAAAPQTIIAPVQGMVRPVQGNFRQTGNFGEGRGGRTHKGIDIGTPMNTPVSASAAGIARVKQDPKGYGLYVEVEHAGGYVTRYGHLNAAEIKDGQAVKQGEVIGRSGNSGRSTGPHLHYEVRKDGKPIDPHGRHTIPGGTVRGSAAAAPARAAGSLSEALARLDADPRIAGDPRRRQIARQVIQEQFQARDYDKRQREEQTQDAAYRWAYENPGASLTRMPASLRAGLDGQTLLRLGEHQQAVAKANAESQMDPMQSARAYVRIQDGITNGTISRADQLLQYAPYLSPGDLKSLSGKLDERSKGTNIDSLKTTGDALGAMDVEIKAAGIDPKKDEDEYVALRARAYRDIELHERRTGKPMTGDEQRALVLGLVGETALKSGGLFGIGASAKRGYQVKYDDIPPEVRRHITSQLVRAGQPRAAITKADVLNYYVTRQ